MELKDIYDVWNRFESSSVSDMDLDFQGVHLSLKKSNTLPSLSQSDFALTPPPEVSENNQKADNQEKAIQAPLVGIFYRASAPGEKPFVEEGESFSKGDVIGIIEAMKCMNEVTAPEDGYVHAICVKDAQLVEYNQPLITYRPSGETHV